MARTTNYGLGQYRLSRDYSYIDKLNFPEITSEKQSDVSYCLNTTTGINYQDILVKLPIVQRLNSDTSTLERKPIVQYGQTYYIELTLPQNPEYQITVDLKLCAGTWDAETGEHKEINLEKFQNIKRLIIPPMSTKRNIYSPVLLFESVNTQNNDDEEIILASVIEKLPSNISNCEIGHVYETESNGKTIYKYAKSTETGISLIEIKNCTTAITLTQTWKVNEESDSTITFAFAFSPKFNLENGYPYLLIETSRADIWNQTIQWVNPTDRQTYYGTTLDISKIRFDLYSVSNLLNGSSTGQAQIQSGTGQLIHIGVWGHPEQILTINGEEIKIGQTGFYELDDFLITSLGVIVKDTNVDRFTIDYEYKITN